MWKTYTPSMVGVFGWSLLLGRLPTCNALISRGVIMDPHGTCCPLCFNFDELVSHLFFLCRSAEHIWLEIHNWIGIAATNTQVGLVQFCYHEMKVDSKYAGKFNYIIWMEVTWCIWYHRNRVVFGSSGFDVVINHAKSISWGWFICKSGCNSCLSIFDWWANPLRCVNIV